MNNIRKWLVGSFWFLALALPATALALGGLVLLDAYLPSLANKLAMAARIDWLSLKLEGSARWPEVAGMIIGQLLIFVFLLLARGKPRLISK